MSHLIIDIETKPNNSLRKLFLETHDTKGLDRAAVNKMMAVHPDYCEIVCIGIKQMGGAVRILKNIKQLGTSQWNSWLNALTLVTYNGKRFDIPILIKHGLREGITLPYGRLENACKKYGYADRHVDLMERLCFGGKWVSLDEMLRIYLKISKETAGPEFFAKATKKELEKHCKQDLEYTEMLAQKFNRLL